MSRCRRTAPIRPSDGDGLQPPAFSRQPGAERVPGRRLSRSEGLSLLELLIVISLLGIFMAAVQESVVYGLRTVNAADEREEIRRQLASALDRLTREARMARNVDNATSTRFQFDADFDGSGSSTGTERNINYEVQSGVLIREHSGGSVVTIVPKLTSLTYDYRDLNDADMTPPVTGGSRADIRVVQVTMTAVYDQESITVADSVYLTNM